MNTSTRLKFARCESLEAATTVLFGADTRGAGFSESPRGAETANRILRSPGFVRVADNASPSLSEALVNGAALFDAGDVSLVDETLDPQIDAVEKAFRETFARGQRAIALGGDHILKFAALRAVSQTFSDCGVLYFDAHPDCADRPLCYASILHHAWSLPNLGPQRTSLVGFRQCNAREAQGLEHWKPGIVRSQDFAMNSIQDVAEKVLSQLGDSRRVYISVDLDGLAPSDAPAVEAPFPGGPLLRELIALIQLIGLRLPFVGMDITEFLPALDTTKQTALAAARLIKEFHAAVVRQGSAPSPHP